MHQLALTVALLMPVAMDVALTAHSSQAIVEDLSSHWLFCQAQLLHLLGIYADA